MLRRVLFGSAAVLLAAFVVVQLPPLRGRATNPPVVSEPAWDARATRELARRACFDCHSNETRWPWYARVAPASWLAIRDVERGRSEWNVSAWGVAREQADGEEAAEELREGSMPLAIYLPLHPEARLDAAEREALARGLLRTLGSEDGGEVGVESGHDDD